jgi:putative hydrolase of the HAD superfamily
MVRAVLFDLDDTLFDHRLCARTALSELHGAHVAFQARPFAEFERMHAAFLEELHHRVLTGELKLDAARQERFRRLFQAVGATPDDEIVEQAAATYREGYRRIRQPVAGAARLLHLVRARALVGIVSNNLLEEQQDKLRHCGLDPFVDALVVSEEAGVSKPDAEIFEIALDRLGCAPAEAVMVGDSWAADVIGALTAGIRAIWFNPLGKPAPDPDAVVQQLRTLDPDEALPIIFGGPAATGSDRERLGTACE